MWQDRMRQSDADFRALVWPNISGPSRTLNGELVSVQMDGLTSTSSRTLDVLGGIDYLVVQEDSTVTTIAARVEYVADPYASFTVGFAEFEQKQRAIAAGAIVAVYTCQAYVSRDGEHYLGASLVPTRELFRFADEFPGCITTQQNTYSGDPFRVIWDECLGEEGFDVRFYLGDAERFITKTGTHSVRDVVCDDCAAELDEQHEADP